MCLDFITSEVVPVVFAGFSPLYTSKFNYDSRRVKTFQQIKEAHCLGYYVIDVMPLE